MSRWTRFSLRSLLVGVMLCSVVCLISKRALVGRPERLMARARNLMQSGGCQYREWDRRGTYWLQVDERFTPRMAAAVNDAKGFEIVWVWCPQKMDVCAELAREFDYNPKTAYGDAGHYWMRRTVDWKTRTVEGKARIARERQRSSIGETPSRPSNAR